MQIVTAILLAVLVPAGQGEDKRYGIAPDLKTFPQTTPKETLASVLKAVEMKRFDYLAAQLADPVFIDDRVKRLFGGRFEEQVDDLRMRMDPATVKLLHRFLKEGHWIVEKEQTTVSLADVADRRVYLRQIGDRWYLEHRSKLPKKPKKNGER
jgi:hypothetical protein